jgi:penicillin-binding protein 1A
MRKLYKFIKFCFYLCLLCVLLGAAGIYGLFVHFSQDLPKLDNLRDYSPPVVSEVYAEDGSKIGEYWLEKRIVLTPNEIPLLIKQAIISSEDDRFFEHSGIDYFGILRAMVENLRAGAIVQGGSTITQQVVKTFLLTKERTYERKIKEAILAKRLEDNFSKEEILYLYLNQTYFGNRAYGVEAASENYFHKTAKELSIAEAAMIAGLAKAPTKFSPITNYTRAKERQEYVIQRLYEEKYITEAQMKEALAQKLVIYKGPTDKEFNIRYAPWFVEEIRRQIIAKYGENAPYTHGLRIYTTLDLKAQKAADAAVWRGVLELHERHGYNGPIKHLEENEYNAFFWEAHKQLYYEQFDPDLLMNVTDDDIAKSNPPLKKDKIYQGVVTEINNATRTMIVRVGNVKGTIDADGYGWARKRNNMSSGYNGVRYINSPSPTFKVGDVVEVMVREPKAVKVAATPAAATVTSASVTPATVVPEQISFNLVETPQAESALFSYEPQTGYVRAVVGGKDFTKSEFNRATQALRQTGSAFKPMLYGSALDKGFTPETVIEDAPLTYEYAPGRFWSPQNYGGGYMGSITMRTALVNSRNIPSVRILMSVGLNYAVAFCRKMGITTPIGKYYPMALGAIEMKLYELARAFGTYPNGGIRPELIWIKKMTDRSGAVLEENRPPAIKPFAQQVKDGDYKPLSVADNNPAHVADALRPDLWNAAQEWIEKDKLKLTANEKLILYGKFIPEGYTVSPKTAWTMVSMMSDIVNHGTGYKVHELGRPAAGKTGTTNDLTDTWFIGYVPDLVAGIWVGYDQNKVKVGAGETGGKAAAPIFLYYMQKFLEGKPIKQFEPPDVDMAQLKAPANVFPPEAGDQGETPLGTDGTEPPKGGGADFFINDF